MPIIPDLKKVFLLAATFSLSSPALQAAPITMTPVQIQALSTWTYTLAMQAATWGSPLVTMYALRYNDAVGPTAKAAPNHIWRMTNISTPSLSKEAAYVSPNVNTLYGFGFMDLRREPIILTAPDSHGLYYVIQIIDMWTNAFAYVGGKATGYHGGRFALVGPHWKGALPPGIQVIRCPTPWVLLQPRVHIYQNGHLVLTEAETVLHQIQTHTLSEYLGRPALPPMKEDYPAPQALNPNQPVSALQYRDPLQFWALLVTALNENPPPADQIHALLPMFHALGISLGQPWQAQKLSPVVLAAMKKAAEDIGPLLDHLPVGQFAKGAFLPPPTIGNFGNDYRTRAVIARVGLTANTPFEAIYWDYVVDSQGQPLSGRKKYTMTFQAAPPYIQPGFWSLTLYDSRNNYTVPNPLNRYMLGSDTPLKKNPDGSFTLYIQASSPGKEKETNWLPAPQGPFYLIPRVYAPQAQMIRILNDPKAWSLPIITSVGGE